MVALFLNCSVGDELKFCLATRGQLLNDLLFLLGVEHALAALQRTVIFAAGSLVVTRMQGSGFLCSAFPVNTAILFSASFRRG